MEIRRIKKYLKRLYWLFKYGVVYYPIPKIAYSTMSKGLEKPFHYNSWKNYWRFSRNPFFKKISFVRNPYDRMVSCYENKINHPKKTEGIAKKHFNLYYGMSFREFVKEVSKIPDKDADIHLKSQSWYLTDKKGNLFPDFIGRFENLEEDYRKICKNIGIKNPAPLPQKNKSKRKKDYRDYYDEETKKLVQERYKKDFELFGYEY